MSTRVLLVCCGATAATRRGAFARDEPILGGDAVGPALRPRLAADRAWARATAPGARVAGGPELRCRQTAEALELALTPVEALRDWDLGAWAGRTLDEALTADPRAVEQWLTDPDAAPHGGESLTALIARVSAWLDAPADAPDDPRRRVVVASPAVLRAALTAALQAPPASFWRLDVTPLAVSELTGVPARWSLRL